MERLTKRVGCGEAVPVAEGDICANFIKAGLCKTGIQGGLFGTWERHCNDTCVLGTIIDKLAAYEDTGLTPEDVVPVVRCAKCRWFDKSGYDEDNAHEEDLSLHMGWCSHWRRGTQACAFCSYGERKDNGLL